jgi:Endoplasmic reticulum vesicle transporter
MKFSFGDDFPGASPDPLHGKSEIITSGLGRFTYYLQIVPTVYQYASGADIHTFQYAMTKHKNEIHVQPGQPFMQPGLFFQYDFASYSVLYAERRAPLTHLLRSIVSIVMGTWMLFGALSIGGRFVEERVSTMKKND